MNDPGPVLSSIYVGKQQACSEYETLHLLDEENTHVFFDGRHTGDSDTKTCGTRASCLLAQKMTGAVVAYASAGTVCFRWRVKDT